MLISKKRINKYAIVILLIALTPMLFIFSIGILNGSTISFGSEEPLTLTWEQVEDGVDVVVCNEGTEDIQSLEFYLREFNFFIEGEKSLKELIKLDFDEKETITGNSCIEIEIKNVPNTQTPDPGKYEGLLIVSGPGIAPIRKSITIIQELKYTFDKVTLEATRSGPFPLMREVELIDSTIPIKSSDLDKIKNQIEKNPYLGFVQNDNGDYGYVYIDKDIFLEDLRRIAEKVKETEEKKTEEGGEDIFNIPVRVDGLYEVGDYSGQLILPGDLSNEEAIEINIKVSDKLIWFIIAVILSLSIPALTSLWAKRWPYIIELKRRCRGLLTGYEDAKKKFEEDNKSNEGNKEIKVFLDLKTPNELEEDIMLSSKELFSYKWIFRKEKLRDIKKEFKNKNVINIRVNLVEKYQLDFARLLNSYSKDNWLFDTISDEFKNIIGMIENAENDIKQIGDDDKFLLSFKKLIREEKELRKFLNKTFVVNRKPLILLKINKFLLDVLKFKNLKMLEVIGTKTDIGIKAKADEFTRLIGQWKEIAEKVKKYIIWCSDLSEIKIEFWRDKELFKKASAKVVEAWNELLSIKNNEELMELEIENDLKQAYVNIAYLCSRYEVWEQPAVRDMSTGNGVSKQKSRLELSPVEKYENFLNFKRLEITDRYKSGSDIEILRKNIKKAEKLKDKLSGTFLKSRDEQDFKEQLEGNKQNFENKIEEIQKEKKKLFKIFEPGVPKIEKLIHWFGDTGVLLISLATVIVTGLKVSYYGNTFGSAIDYLTIIFIGIGAETSAKIFEQGIKESIKKFWRKPIQSEVIKE